jgi:hypothetical protein
MCLLTAHFHRVQYFNPPQAVVDAFQEEEFEFGSSAQGLKGKLINAGPRSGLTRDVILFTDLHLWSQVDPPALDPNHPFEEEPTFDVHAFTLPTAHGPVAPARFRPWGVTGDAPFGGATCDFMHPVYFRQEILVRYEVSDGFVVEDDGSVVCRHFWALNRSTRRIGNELIATAIGDFAEGVPIEEWPYWKLHAVEPPSAEASQSLHSQRTIASAVNSLIEALQGLNRAFLGLSTALGVTNSGNVWTSSPDSLAGRQLKWFYPVPASEDEFLKRATLLSTFALEGLSDTALRSALIAIARELHLNDENPRRPLGSRRLLQRLTLSATVIASLRPSLEALSDLVFEAERERAGSDPELESELHALRDDVRSDFAPLAFLYDLRRFGGLAHVPNMPKAHIAAKNLGIAEGNWSRTDYIGLIDRISASARKIATTLCVAAETVVGSEKP